MKDKNIVKKIKMAMLEKDMNQSELAEKLGITKSVVSNWFIGNRNPKMETLEKIASVLDVPVSYFLNNEQNILNTGNTKENNSFDFIINLMEKQNKLYEEMNKKFELEVNYLKDKVKNLEEDNKTFKKILQAGQADR